MNGQNNSNGESAYWIRVGLNVDEASNTNDEREYEQENLMLTDAPACWIRAGLSANADHEANQC